jgi:hypothetical protein
MVKRFATFALLGPFLVWLSGFIWEFPEMIRMSRDSAEVAFIVVTYLFIFIAVAGFIPGLALAGADQVMAKRRLPRVWRAAACAALAYPAAALAIWIVLAPLGVPEFKAGLPVSALFGVIPAALCSLLAGRWDRGKNL